MDFRLDVIENIGQLPLMGQAFEHRMFDMKEVPNKQQIENAKDIAAFANVNGGIILIGAIEDKNSGLLVSYKPLSEEDAREAQKSYEAANQDLCSPVPIVDTRIIRIVGGCVLAVTVSPFPGQVVGIKVISDKQTHGKGLTTWAFPIRQGTQTDYLRPEHTAMLMSAKTRIIAIGLSRIPLRQGVSIRLCYRAVIGTPLAIPAETTIYARAEFHECRVIENRVLLYVENPNQREMSPVNIPLDAIQSVWQGANSYQWDIALGGTIMFPQQGDPFYSYHVSSR